MSRDPSVARVVGVLIVGLMAIMSVSSGHLQAAPAQEPAAAAPAPTPRAVIDRYCVTCHNERLRSAGTVPFAFDGMDIEHVVKDGSVWDKVIRRLRARSMPTVGRPRPDEATYDSVVAYLETEFDRAAVANPNPGNIGPFHRLTRTEYAKAIRDLLALEALPKELDIETLLPADNSSTGFDNLADLLFVSPTALDGYLSAARKISRVAVGDPEIPVLVDRYLLPRELPQDVRLEGAPFGTRGGQVIHTTFPVDGNYRLKIEFASRARDPHELEVSVDGERVQLFTVGDNPDIRRGSGVFQVQADQDIETVLPLKAGPRVIAVTFIEHTPALGEQVVRPRLRSRGALPALAVVTVSGPYAVTGSGDTPSRRRLFVCQPKRAAAELPCAKEVLSTLTRRAYRRASTDQDVEVLLPFYEAGRAEGGFERGIQQALERVLISPHFLFRIERELAPGTVASVSDVELASRLSFFLWSSIPDDELLDLALRGKLKEPAVLAQQVRRMLADWRSEALVTNFAAQWLFLRDVDGKRPDGRLFADFDESLRQAMKRETNLFLESLIREDRSALEVLSANHTFLNERLAKHYGIPHVYGPEFRRVTLTDDYRRGLLGQGSILVLTSYSTRTSPVLRGKYVLANLLGDEPPPPPPNVPSLVVDSKDSGEALSMRDAMIQHRVNPVCASCHSQMDPIGFALDNFDAVGRWRTTAESGMPIDPSGVLPGGRSFEGVVGLRNLLLERPEEFLRTMTEKLLTYALGRSLEYYDSSAVRTIVRDASREDHRFSSLILGIIKSTPFQMRASMSAPPAEVAAP